MQPRVLIIALLLAFQLGVVVGLVAARASAPDSGQVGRQWLEEDLSIPRLEWQQ